MNPRGAASERSPSAREKTCEACGKVFLCVGADGCWCGAVKLEPKRSEDLRSRYNDCLCEACLRAAAQPGPS